MEWRCSLGHQWFAIVYNRTNSKNKTGCPVCNGKVVLPGFNDVLTTHPHVAALFADSALATTITAFSNIPVRMRCLTDSSHEWDAPPSRISAKAGGCPYCSGRAPVVGKNDLATTHPDIAAMLLDPELGTQLKAGSARKVEWICATDSEHRWVATPYSLTTKRTGCPVCSGRVADLGKTDLATTHPQLTKTLVNPDDAQVITFGSNTRLLWQCQKKSTHTWLATPTNRVKGGCPACANRRVVVGENDLSTTHPNLAAELVDPREGQTVTAGGRKAMLWQCPQKPEHQWEAALYQRTGHQPTGCPLCFGPLPSRGERTLGDVITQLVAPDVVLTSDQSILPGRHELDIVVPARKIAIEFNGVYWHSEAAGKPQDFHSTKSALAAEAGMQLIHVWEDEWRTRPEVVIRALAHKLHAVDRLLDVLLDADPKIAERVFARQLAIGEARGAEAATFLNANHIQGPVVATRHFVLQDDDGDVRAILSVRSPRNNARMNRKHGEWEIQRYATLGVIPGGFSKLLRHAEQSLRAEGTLLTQWVSFSAQDISDGGMYEANGFVAEALLPADYKYVGNHTQWRRSPKEAFQKKRFRDDPDLLWQEGWTEREAAAANGLYRIYDSGKTRWVKPVG